MEEEVLDMFESRKRALAVKGNTGSNPIVLFEGSTHVMEESDDESDQVPKTCALID
jgi:hypothetical protein